jgi:hypothetical protein
MHATTPYTRMQKWTHVALSPCGPETPGKEQLEPDLLCKHKLVLSSPKPIVKIKHLSAPQEPVVLPEAVPAFTLRPWAGAGAV